MSELIKQISDYVYYLKSTGLFISLHYYGHLSSVFNNQLICHNIHQNPYCMYVKSHNEIRKRCLLCQEKVLNHCQNGEYFGMCHCGVDEFVYPILYDSTPVGFISVSGYCSDISKGIKKIRSLCNEFHINSEPIEEIYKKSLSADIPNKQYIDSLIFPISAMFELAHIKIKNNYEYKNSTGLYPDILNYINLNYSQNITVEAIAKHFSYSRSTISHLFKKHNGKSISEYVTFLRLSEAFVMLKTSDMTITEIAIATGFSDPNYFSSVFKKHYSVSPQQYRKNKNILNELH